MAPPSIPSAIAQYIKAAATGTGLPEAIVAAQNYDESGYGTNMGPSSAGALGPWQFEPATFTGLGFPAGQENSWPISTQAYIKYMNQLLAQEHGNVRNALAAYNAGPGNLSAGYGYADHIIAMAGTNPGSVPIITGGSATANNSGNFLGIGNPLSGLLAPFTEIARVFTDIDTIIMDLLKPSFWLRIGSFIAGVFLLVAGIWALMKASDNGPLIPQNIPAVIPV